MTDKKKQITATLTMSAEDKIALQAHAKAANTSLSMFMTEAALQSCGLKKLIIDLDKQDGYVLLPTWMNSNHLRKAAAYLELLEDAPQRPNPTEE